MLIGFVGFEVGGELGASHVLGIGRSMGIEKMTSSGLSQTSVARYIVLLMPSHIRPRQTTDKIQPGNLVPLGRRKQLTATYASSGEART